MSIATILILVLIILLLGGLSQRFGGYGQGHGLTGLIGVVLIVILVLLLLGKV
ncbi:DUF3309 family protein [Rhodopseudomonas palustris]|uniref:DUF3309 family protein n=1 Tax=Rhodopseudomonas palustris TaxID=1076 RepID=UPI002ACEA401|nr:DUF3309 family protein [Rhodopseudomonas palustris]WQG97494.1 DUF3309 family protein [Rhodopseudomonas palustris]